MFKGDNNIRGLKGGVKIKMLFYWILKIHSQLANVKLNFLAGDYQIKLINYTAGCYIIHVITAAGTLGWASSVQGEWRPRNGVSISLIL